MSLVDPVDRDAGILSLAFNQDRTCIAIASVQGVRIYSIDLHKVLYSDNIGAVRTVEMLYCTNLLAFVGAGEQPALTPRKLTVLNTNGKKLIKEMSFPTAVLAIKMNRKRLVVILERRVFIYELENLSRLRVLDTPPNPRAVCALSTRDDLCYLALPASGTSGVVRMYDILMDGGNVLCEIPAHKSPLRVVSMNDDSSLLATSSQTGTLIHVHDLPNGEKLFTLRRGSTPATIHSISFSPLSLQPPLLVASGSHGTMHVFRLQQAGRGAVGMAASAAAGLLSAVTRFSVNDLVDPLRSIVSVPLPNQSVPSHCTIIPSEVSLVDEEQNTSNGVRTSMDKIVLGVATLDGFFYEYNLTDYDGVNPRIVQTGEWRLLGSRSLRI